MSNVTFYDRVEDALNNEQLKVALTRTTSKLGGLRINALASLPDADGVRDRARLIRAHTISKLADYLEQFAANVEKMGGHVHFADDAALKAAMKSPEMAEAGKSLQDAMKAGIVTMMFGSAV